MGFYGEKYLKGLMKDIKKLGYTEFFKSLGLDINKEEDVFEVARWLIICESKEKDGKEIDFFEEFPEIISNYKDFYGEQLYFFKKGFGIKNPSESQIKEFENLYRLTLNWSSKDFNNIFKIKENERNKKFIILANRYKKDMINLCDITEKQFNEFLERDSFNTEGEFERKLFAIMLLKDFNNNEELCGKITNVKVIGGGFYNDGMIFGIKFDYDGKNYQFGTNSNDPETIMIPINGTRKALVKAINESCDNYYSISCEETEEL